MPYHKPQHSAPASPTGLMMTALLLCLYAMPVQAAAPKTEPASTPLLQSNSLSFDENTNIITAVGNVEMSTGDRILRADKITYNKTTDVVHATGHVALTEASGEIMYAHQMELTSDIKQGFIEKIGVLFPDNSRLVANDAQRFEGRYLITQRGIYSSCNLCKDDPTKAPLWQLKGARITHDSETKNVMYRDATLEFHGIPVFYTPYFSHPDPSVKRRQGFLTPTGGMKNTLGTVLRTPYYIDLAPNSDLLLDPTFSTSDKVQLEADWRYRFANGTMKWEGSVAQTKFTDESGVTQGDRVRGHIFGTTQFALNKTWRAGTDVAYSSDKSYLQRYSIAANDVLVNRIYAENFKGRNYGAGNMYYFQDLRPGDQQAEPFVAPELRYSALGEPGAALGGRWAFNSGLLVTSRARDVPLQYQGPSTRRLSLDAGWERQLTSSTGFLTTVSALARADTYWADNVPKTDAALGTGFTNVNRTRPFAQGNVSVRYPLGRHGEGYSQILEPIVALSVAPRVSRSTLYPNEDSLDVEFDETNLFSPNRFTGIDRVEGGTRAAYGLRHAIIGDNGARIEMLGGQVFRTKEDNSFGVGSGLTERLSDYVGRVDFEPVSWLGVNYGFRLDQDQLDFTRQEAQVTVGTPVFKPFVNYLSTKQTQAGTTVPSTVEETTFGFSSNFTKYWTLASSHRQAILPDPGPRSTNVSLTYHDECFTTGVTASQDHTSRLDIQTGKSIMFLFYLKNIGGLSTN